MKKVLILALFGLTLAGEAQPLPTIELRPVFPALKAERPVWMTEAPDGSRRQFIVYQSGKILVVHPGSNGADAKEFLNIEDRHPDFENECGLLSLAFHPGFATNRLFYIYYTQKNSPDQNSRPLNFPFRSVISEFKTAAGDPDRADLATERPLLEVPQPYGNHKGGQVSFGPDGYLYIGLGDGGGGNDPFGNGQNTATLLGKILRLDVNTRATVGRGNNQRQLPYGIPNDNPFMKEADMGDRGARREIFAYGLRNPWRYSWDAKNGDLWAGDVGQNLWEEVDLIRSGGNYGWNVREGAHHFKPGPEGARYIEPVIEYPHRTSHQPQALFPDHGIGVSITGGYVYRGKKFPALEGIYLYADYGSGTIWGFRYDREAHTVTAHGALLEQKKNITSFAEDREGEVYALTQDGGIYSIAVP